MSGKLYQESGGSDNDRANEAMRILEMLTDTEEIQMNEKERGFVQQLRERVEKYGAKTMVSPKQLFWLRDIKEHYL